MRINKISTLISLKFRPSVITVALLPIATTLLLASCTSESTDYTSATINRLDLTLRGDGNGFSDNNSLLAAKRLFEISGYGEFNDSTLAVYQSNKSIKFHEQAVDSVWDDTKTLSNKLGRLKSNFNRLFPDNRFPEIYTIISPFNQSILTVDSMLYIGLNHYLGVDYQPYFYFPDYIRLRKTPDRLVIDVAETLLRRDFPYQAETNYPTTLSRLLYEGALIEAEMQLCEIGEQKALGYDDRQMKWLESNERKLWNVIVGQKHLFSTNPQTASSLTALAPFTSVIGNDVPGAAGRFIGHRIVKSYLDRKATSIEELLSPDFYASPNTLSDSQY